MADIEIRTGGPLADALQNVIQPKLAENGWSSGAEDDSALSEYIVLMLANEKSQEQIASELATDLLGLPADDPGPSEFAQWLFQQVHIQNARLNGVTTTTDTSSANQTGFDAGNDEMDMQDSSLNGHDDISTTGVNPPSGPKSMRNGTTSITKGRGSRMLGQMRSAMDRAGGNNAAVHKIQGAASRAPPAGPRNMATKMQNLIANGGRNGQPMNQQMMNTMASNVNDPSQMALLQVLEEQSRMMAQFLSQQGQQAAINPNFYNKQQNRQQKSLFDRVGKPNSSIMKHNRKGADTDAMETGDEATKKSASETPCKFQLQCTNDSCIYAHQSPAAPPHTSVDVTDTCSYGAACTNRKCVASHPSPAQKRQYLSNTVDCKFFPNCKHTCPKLKLVQSLTSIGTNPACPFRHPNTAPCRNGADCPEKDSGCKFSHSSIQCRYHPCLNPGCIFKHVEGQRQDPKASTDHVSERKFTTDGANGVAEELIIPGSMDETEDVAPIASQEPPVVVEGVS